MRRLSPRTTLSSARQGPLLLEGPQIADRSLVLSQGLVGHGPRAEGHEHARVLGEEACQLADGLVRLGPRHRHPVSTEARREADPVLGVLPRRRRGLPAARPEVPEGPQALGRLGVDRLDGHRRGRGHHLSELPLAWRRDATASSWERSFVSPRRPRDRTARDAGASISLKRSVRHAWSGAQPYCSWGCMDSA